MTKVLVTGSMGFVGRHLVAALQEHSPEVSVVGLDSKSGIVFNDVATEAALVFVTKEIKPDIIVHLASTCSTLGSILRPDETFRDAVITNANMLEAARRLNVPYILTTSVKARDGMTPYGAAKRMNELWAIEYARMYDFPIVINRPGTIYGPGQEGSIESGWIAWFMKAKREGLPVTIYGDGTQRRDLLHVSDYVALLMLQIEDPLRYAYREYPQYIGDRLRYANGIWDIGGGESNAVSVEEIADYLDLDHVHGHERKGDAKEYIGSPWAGNWQPKVRWRESEVFQEFVPTSQPGESLSGSFSFNVKDLKITFDNNLMRPMK